MALISGQCFNSFIKCRISAVFGGIYMLNHSVKHLLIDESSNNFTGLIDVNGQQLSSTYLITSIDYIPENLLQENEEWYVTNNIYSYLINFKGLINKQTY
jgi:hypothetical protein